MTIDPSVILVRWQDAQATGEPIGATRDPKQLEKLSKYAGDWRYDTPDDAPEVTWKTHRFWSVTR